MRGDFTRRVWRIDAGSQQYEGLDFRAVVKWPRSGKPAVVDLTVYHPPATLIASIREGERVAVLAGYADAMGAVEVGGGVPVSKSIEYDRTSVDMPLKVQLNAISALSRVVLSGSWPTTSARQVLAWVAREAGLTVDDQSERDAEYPYGYFVEGGVQGVIEDLAADLGCRWMIDGVNVRLWPRNGVARETATLWMPSTGLMVASTTGGAAGEIQAMAVLTPGLRQGHVVRIKDLEHIGDVRTLEVAHELDTQGDTWQTSIVGVPRG